MRFCALPPSIVDTWPSKTLNTSMHSPIFMLGALRSGTTVFRLMLDSHEHLRCPDETDFIFDYLNKKLTSKDWGYDLEGLRLDRIFQTHNLSIPSSEDGKEIAHDFVKQLGRRSPGILCLSIHRNADKVAAVFPGCKIIHLIRDPRDVASSCLSMGWAGNTYYGVDHWLQTESNWESAASQFGEQDVLELRFKELILNPRAQLERVCRFIGVSFSSAMLNYSEKSTYAPPDPSAIEQWKTKLGPREIALVEIKSKSLLLRRNYELSGYSLEPPGLPERLALFLANKAYKWRFGVHRYGTVNFIMEKVTRRLLKPFYPIFRQRINEIDEQYLK